MDEIKIPFSLSNCPTPTFNVLCKLQLICLPCKLVFYFLYDKWVKRLYIILKTWYFTNRLVHFYWVDSYSINIYLKNMLKNYRKCTFSTVKPITLKHSFPLIILQHIQTQTKVNITLTRTYSSINTPRTVINSTVPFAWLWIMGAIFW